MLSLRQLLTFYIILMNNAKHKYSIEELYHFQCCICTKWWTIGDCSQLNQIYCPWCGAKADAEKKEAEVITSASSIT